MKNIKYLLLVLLTSLDLSGYTIICDNYEVDFNYTYSTQVCTDINEYPTNLVVQIDTILDLTEINLLLTNIYSPFDSILLNIPLENGIGEIDHTFSTTAFNVEYSLASLELGACNSNLYLFIEPSSPTTPQNRQAEITVLQNTSIFNQALDNYPSNIPYFSHKGGIISFNESDTTFNYSPPLDYVGPDAFYYWSNETSNDELNYSRLNYISIDINHPDFHIEILSLEIDFNYNYELQLIIYSSNEGFTISGVSETPISLALANNEGLNFYADYFPLNNDPVYSPFIEVLGLQDSLYDAVYLPPSGTISEWGVYGHYCNEIDTLSISEDSITIAIPNSFAYIKYCDAINPVEITDEVFYSPPRLVL